MDHLKRVLEHQICLATHRLSPTVVCNERRLMVAQFPGQVALKTDICLDTLWATLKASSNYHRLEYL
jgi:hypothetical protein